MTQYPGYPPQQQQLYYGQQQPVGSGRPGSVTGVAITGIIWGILMLLCNGIGLIPALMTNFGGPNPAMDEVRAHPIAGPYQVVGPIVGLGLAILLLAGSVGALGLKPWARMALIVFSLAEILAGIVNAFVTIGVVNPIVGKNLQNMGLGGNGANAPSPQMMSMAQGIGAFIAVAIAMVLPIILLIVLNKANVKAAFAGTGTGYGGTGGYGGGGGAYPPMQQQQQYPQQ